MRTQVLFYAFDKKPRKLTGYGIRFETLELDLKNHVAMDASMPLLAPQNVPAEVDVPALMQVLRSNFSDAAPAKDTRNDRIKELEALVRSACAIAERRGESTHWERFVASVKAAGLSGVTARTYRVLP